MCREENSLPFLRVVFISRCTLLPREKEHPEQSSPRSLGGTYWLNCGVRGKYCLFPAEASLVLLFLARLFGLYFLLLQLLPHWLLNMAAYTCTQLSYP